MKARIRSSFRPPPVAEWFRGDSIKNISRDEDVVKVLLKSGQRESKES